MSMKTIARSLVAACCAVLGLNAWAADIEITNVGKIVPSGASVNTAEGNYPIAGLRITADSSLGLANGDVLKIKKIAIAYNTSGANTATHHLQLAGIDSAEKTTDESMAIGSESVATYVFNETVYAVVGATTQLRALTADGTATNFRCRVYDHQDTTQVAQLRMIETASNYAALNWGAMFRVVAEKVPTYTKSSLTAYINKDSAQTLISGATLADITKGKVIGQVNGGWISDSFKNNLIEPFNVTEVKDEGTQEVTSITMQFQLKESRNLVKAVLAECTQDGDNVVIKAVDAKANESNDHYGEDASSWTTSTVATSDGGRGYGIHNLTFVVPYEHVYTVESSMAYADLNVEAPAAGEKAAVVVSADAVLTFANETIPTGVDFVAEDATSGIKVAGAIPAALFSKANVNIVGESTIAADIPLAGSELTLTGGSIGPDTKAIKFTTDTVSISASGTSSILKLWGTGHTATINVATDGELTVGKIVNNYDNTIVKDGEGSLKVVNNASNKQVKYQLKAGSIVAKAAETDITPHSSVSGLVIVESEPDTEGYTTYTLGLAPRTEATTITMKDWTGTAFTYVDGDTTRDTTLMEGDKIVIPSTIADDNYWQWHFTDGDDAFAGHEVEINKNMNWKWSVGTMTIGSGATVYVFNTYGLNDGASISGEGTLSVNGVDVPVNGAATISCTTIAFAGGNFKLTTVGSTLTSAKLDEGEEITKVVSGVEGYDVDYTDGVYSLVEASEEVPEIITEGSDAQKTAYAEWAEANGVSGSATAELAAAFAIGAEGEDEESVLEDAQDELVAILATIDLTKITTEAFTLPAYPNATFQFVEASLGEGVTTTANLFRLTVEFLPANSQSQN